MFPSRSLWMAHTPALFTPKPKALIRQASILSNVAPAPVPTTIQRESKVQGIPANMAGSKKKKTSSATAKSDPIAKTLSKAFNAHYVQCETGTAIPMYTSTLSALRASPNKAGRGKLSEVLFNMATAHLSQLDEAEAVVLLNEAIEVCPNRSKALRITLSLAHARQLDDIEGANVLYDSVVSIIESENADTILADQVDTQFTRSTLCKADVYCQYGKSLWSEMDIERAEVYFTKALDVPTISYGMQVLTLDFYSGMLRDVQENDRAEVLEERMFALAAKYNLEVSVDAWKRRIDLLGKRGADLEVTNAYESALRGDLEHEDRSGMTSAFLDHLEATKDYARAYDEYTKALAIEPNHVIVMIRRAWCAHSMRAKNDTVEALFKEAVATLLKVNEESDGERSVSGTYVHGEYAMFLHDKEKRLEEARVQYLLALAYPGGCEVAGYAQVVANFAMLLASLGDHTECAKWFEKVVDLPPHYKAWLLYVDYLILHSHVEKGLAAVEKMFVMFPEERSTVQMRMAKLYEMEAPVNVDKLITAYLVAIKLGCPDPTAELPLHELCEATANIPAVAEYAAILNYRLKKVPEAMTCYRVLRRRIPDDVNVAVHYGRLLYDNGYGGDVAMEQFMAALRVEPGNVFALDCLAEYRYSHLKDLDAAEDCHLQSMRHNYGTTPTGAHAAHQYASFLFYIGGKTDLASALFSDTTKLYPSDGEGLVGYALHLQLSAPNRMDKGRINEMFLRAIKADPTSVLYNQLYGAFLSHHQVDMALAAKYFQEALRLDPESMDVLVMVADFLIRRATMEQDPRYFEQAESVFQEMFRVDAKDVKALAKYASYLEEVKKDKAAATRIRTYIRDLGV